MKEASRYKEVAIKALIERTSNICFAYDVAEKKFIYTNTSLEFFFELIAQEISKDSNLLLHTIFDDDVPYAFELYKKLLQKREIDNVALRFKTSGNKIKALKLEAWLLDIDEAQIIAGIAYDITAETEQLLVLNKFAEKKNSILEILSHDLTAPLGNIQMCSALLRSQIDSLNKQVLTNLLDKIINNTERSLNLIRDFLKREFLETFEATLVKQRINIAEKINNFIEEFKKEEANLNKTISVITNAEPLYILADEPKFIQVIQNLVSNAMKFTPDGGTITITITDKDPDVLIAVEDNGIGIPEHLQKDLFEKFSNARRTGLKGEQSVGLGMSIIKRIVEWHNGNIWFNSEENKGTTFYIQIPKDNG